MNSTNFSQDDIDTLFKIDYGCAGFVSPDLAARLTLVGYLESKEPLQGTATTVDAEGERHLGITYKGRLFMAAIRDGLEPNWTQWKP